MFGTLRSGNRLWTGLVGIALTCALTACGSATTAAPSGSALATELSYLPAGSPVLATITTDPNSAPVRNLGVLLSKFQVASLLTSSLKQFSGWIAATPSALTGNVTLTVK